MKKKGPPPLKSATYGAASRSKAKKAPPPLEGARERIAEREKERIPEPAEVSEEPLLEGRESYAPMATPSMILSSESLDELFDDEAFLQGPLSPVPEASPSMIVSARSFQSVLPPPLPKRRPEPTTVESAPPLAGDEGDDDIELVELDDLLTDYLDDE